MREKESEREQARKSKIVKTKMMVRKREMYLNNANAFVLLFQNLGTG